MEQMTALQEQEVVAVVALDTIGLHNCLCDFVFQDSRREKLLVERLMRQCQQERRIATQLMHIRKEKDTIRNNR